MAKKQQFIVLVHNGELGADWIIADSREWADFYRDRFVKQGYSYAQIREVGDYIS